MASNFEKVGEFHKACDLKVTDEYGPQWPMWDVRKLRKDLIEEEYYEFVEADLKQDMVGIADALADILYVAYGAAHAYGIDIDAVFAEVHRSNMTKVVDGKVIRREDGKILKPEGWTPPDIKGVLFGKGSNSRADERDSEGSEEG